MNESDGLPLAGLCVVDLTGDLGRHPGRLFADLGADVVRVRLPGIGLDPARGPQIEVGEGESLGAEYVVATLGQRVECLEPGSPRLTDLLDTADVVITDLGPARLHELGIRERDGLVHVAISAYGQDGPWADRPATDLTLLAAGGLLNLAGEPSRAPVRPAGGQAAVATGLHATVGALIALFEREGSGEGQTVDVSAQQAVAHSLENAVQFADLEGTVRGRTAGTPTEAGNGLFRCLDGWVYLVAGIGGTPLGWPGVLAWLTESGVDVTELRGPRWQDARWRRTPVAAEAFRAVFEAFTTDRPKAELYESGQRHGVSLAPVATPADLLASPQLAERGFFRRVPAGDREITVPGAPYRFDGTAVGPQGGPAAVDADRRRPPCDEPRGAEDHMAQDMARERPRLLLLDDWERRMRSAPAAEDLRRLADLTVLDVPLAEVPDDELRDVRAVVAIRERTRFDRATLDRFPHLELILQTGGHAYHIDQDEARRRGIAVALWRSSEACEAAMRELTFGLAIASLRRFPEAVRAGDDGSWPGLLGGTLRGRRLGILGLGRQGRAVAGIARAFDMDVVAWARPGGGGGGDGAEDIRRLPLQELLATSDVVSINLRLSAESRGLLTGDLLRSMKQGSVLVNTARGAIVDQDALVEVLRDGPLRAAGLDVFAHEPLPVDSPLRTLPNVVLTPHVGWVVDEAFAEFADGAAGQLADYLAHTLDPAELAVVPEHRPATAVGGISRA